MVKDQKAKYNMLQKLLKYLDEHATDFTGYTPLEDAVTLLQQTGTNWDELIEEEERIITGYAQDKDAKKDDMAEYWAQVANTARSWAMAENNQELARAWKRSTRDIQKLTDSEAGNVCEGLHDTINAQLASLGTYGITTALLTTGMAKITAFRALIGKPKEEQGEKSAVGVQIDQLITDRLDPLLIRIDALVKGVYFIANQPFVLGYIEVRVIDDLPTSHTTLTVTFLDDDTSAPLKDVLLRDIRDGGKQALSDVLGVAQLHKFRGGPNLEFSCTLATYQPQTLVRSIKPGQKVTVTIRLKKV